MKTIPFSARYFGEFVPGITRLRYFYKIFAYVGHEKIAESGVVSDFGPPVLDGDHGMSLQWAPVVGSTEYQVFKRRDREPDTDRPADLFYRTGLGETGIFDVGYPATTRNPFLNPGVHVAGLGVSSLNGIEGPVVLYPGDNILIHPHSPVGQDIEIAAYPAGSNTWIQFNGHGKFAATPGMSWNNNRMEITGLQVAGAAEVTGAFNVLGVATLRNRVQIGGAGITTPLRILNIPTSTSGLINGDVYASGNTLHIFVGTPGGED